MTQFPWSRHDVSVDYIVSEEEIIFCKGFKRGRTVFIGKTWDSKFQEIPLLKFVRTFQSESPYEFSSQSLLLILRGFKKGHLLHFGHLIQPLTRVFCFPRVLSSMNIPSARLFCFPFKFYLPWI
ncbi:MAG: hypothetical protein CM1200mP15_03950 [Dehalococcoidia bacterium]|nr:MAG: hypothetical protein CM1200mP15_03950 [Dehalococcoidia bacterium]